MKKPTRAEEDEDVFEFREEEFPDDCGLWSKKMRAEIANPNSDDDGALKYKFLEKYSSGLDTQIKEVPTVTLDEDDDDDDDQYSADDNSDDSLDSPHKAGCEALEGLSSMSHRVLEQHSTPTDSIFEYKLSSPCTQIRVSTQLGHLPGNGHVSPMIPESPCCNGSVDIGDLDGINRVQESSPLTFDCDLEENTDPTFRQARAQSVAGLEMDLLGAVVIHTDYVTYGDKYFPASCIVISKDLVKFKASALEDCSACSCEWKVDDILKIEAQQCSMYNIATVRMRLLTKDAAHAEIGNGTSSVEVVEFSVPNWSQHQERIMSLDVRYSAVLSMGPNTESCDGDAVLLENSECSSDPYFPNFEEPFEEVVYPKGEIDAVSVRKSDVDLLEPDVFVNDTIIDFYITYLKNEIPCDRRRNFHFFSSFFFRKLADLDKNPSSVSDGKAAFQRVRRWTRKVNIFEKDYIFIPVNYNLHWSLIVLCHPGEVANFCDGNIDKALKVPCILHMDSIRGSHAGLKNLLQSYLLEEWKERQKDTSEEISSKFLNLRFLSLELPQQENCSDCGLFLLHYAERFIDEVPQNFSPNLMNKFEQFLKPDWFVPAEASHKRVLIQRLIYELLKSRSHECASPSGNGLSHFQALPVNNDNDIGIEIVSEKRNPDKAWNGSSLYSESVDDIDIGLLNMRYRPSVCVDDSSGLGMTELLEQHQHYDGGQLDFPISAIREVEVDEHLARSNLGKTGLQPVDQVVESHLCSLSGDLDQGFQWNSAFADRGDPEDTSSSDSGSCCDSAEEMRILGCNGGTQSVNSCRNEDMDHSKELFDSQEGYASASSDMMETPAEDSQELAEKFGSHDQEDPPISNPEKVAEASQEAPISNPEKVAEASQEELISNPEEVTEASQVELISNTEEVAEASQDELISDPEEVTEASQDELISNPEEGAEASQEELGNTEEDEEAMSGIDEKLIVEDGNGIVVGADENWVVEDSPPDQIRPTKRLKLTPSRGDERQHV